MKTHFSHLTHGFIKISYKTQFSRWTDAQLAVHVVTPSPPLIAALLTMSTNRCIPIHFSVSQLYEKDRSDYVQVGA